MKEHYNVYGIKGNSSGIPADKLRIKHYPSNYNIEHNNLGEHLKGIDGQFNILSSTEEAGFQKHIEDLWGTDMLSVGVTYNTTKDEFQRIGAAQGQAVNELIDMSSSPVFSQLTRSVVADDGSVVNDISWHDFTKHVDGTDVNLDGSDGQIMVRYMDESMNVGPRYYYTEVIDDKFVVMLSHLPLDGKDGRKFQKHPLFVDQSKVYMGAYEASIYDDKLCSIAVDPADGSSPVWPVTTRTGDWGHAGLNTQVTDQLAEARGAGWQQADLMTRVWERLLQIVGFASFNIPGIVGDGRINITVGDWVNGERIGKCGLGDASAGYASAVQNGGTSGYLTDYSQVLGVENTYGNIWDRVTSLVSDGDVYYKSTPPYDYSSVSGWTRLLDASGAGITLPQASGWAGTPHSGLGMVLPSDVTGSSSTKMHDYYYNNSCSCLRVLLVGGFAYNVSDAGSFYWSAADVASSTYAGIGGRLGFKKAI